MDQVDLHTWLDRPENKGKAGWLAEQLDRTPAAVSFWRDSGVPLLMIERVAALIGPPVTFDAMLKHAMACKARVAAEKAAAQSAPATGPGALDDTKAAA